MENLNKLQQDFVEKMCENIKNIYNGMYLLEAPAGCGKTFCVSYLIHKIPWIDYYVIAPTHKAKKMLSKNLNGNVETVHRFLNSKMEYTKDGEQEYTFNPPPIKNSLIVIDECSMINDEIYDIFLRILHFLNDLFEYREVYHHFIVYHNYLFLQSQSGLI